MTWDDVKDALSAALELVTRSTLMGLGASLVVIALLRGWN